MIPDVNNSFCKIIQLIVLKRKYIFQGMFHTIINLSFMKICDHLYCFNIPKLYRQKKHCSINGTTDDKFFFPLKMKKVAPSILSLINQEPALMYYKCSLNSADTITKQITSYSIQNYNKCVRMLDSWRILTKISL